MKLFLILAEGDPFTPATFGAELTSGVGDILGWVGAGALAGVAVMVAMIGIRAGFRMFRSVGR